MLQVKTYGSASFPELVERIWFLENDARETVLYYPPEPYIHVIVSWTAEDGKVGRLTIEDPRLEGLSFQHRQKKYKPYAREIGIRFYAYGAYPFFAYGAEDTRYAFSFLKELVVEMLTLESMSYVQVTQQIDSLLERLYATDRFDKIAPLQLFYKQVRWGQEPPDIRKFCKEQGLYYTGLNRLFRRVTGVSPKKLDRLMKFRRALCDLLDSERSLSVIGFAAGYFDQAHFIREFKAFSTLTPSAYQQLMRAGGLLQYNFRLF